MIASIKFALILAYATMTKQMQNDDKTSARLQEHNVTFHEVAKSADFGRWTRTRLAEFRNIIWAELDRVPFLASQAWHKKHTLPEADKPA